MPLPMVPVALTVSIGLVIAAIVTIFTRPRLEYYGQGYGQNYYHYDGPRPDTSSRPNTRRALGIFGKKRKPSDDSKKCKCGICSNVIDEKPLPCGHDYHRKCIDQWASTNRKDMNYDIVGPYPEPCPKCREISEKEIKPSDDSKKRKCGMCSKVIDEKPLPCKHDYHQECIDKWASTNNRNAINYVAVGPYPEPCPECRDIVQ